MDDIVSNLRPLQLGNEISKIFTTPQHRRTQYTTGNKDEKVEDKNKKILHREVERVRRQGMTSLYASLRSKLPFECIKGKRSISDHMHEATNYIKYLERNIQQLKHERDALSRLNKHSSNTNTNSTFDDLYVTVQACWIGVEVVVSSRMNDRVVTLSKVLKKLAAEGLDVINCLSIQENGRLLHTVKSEVMDPTASINLPSLQQKLMNLV